MASKVKSVYVCNECGWETSKWCGKCPGCGQWNTMEEELKDTSKKAVTSHLEGSSVYAKPTIINQIDTNDEQRYHTGLKELDRVLGGGIVKGLSLIHIWLACSAGGRSRHR